MLELIANNLVLVVILWIFSGLIINFFRFFLDTETGEVIYLKSEIWMTLMLSLLGLINLYVWAAENIVGNNREIYQSFYLYYVKPSQKNDLVLLRDKEDDRIGYVEQMDTFGDKALVCFTRTRQKEPECKWFPLNKIHKF